MRYVLLGKDRSLLTGNDEFTLKNSGKQEEGNYSYFFLNEHCCQVLLIHHIPSQTSYYQKKHLGAFIIYQTNFFVYLYTKSEIKASPSPLLDTECSIQRSFTDHCSLIILVLSMYAVY